MRHDHHSGARDDIGHFLPTYEAVTNVCDKRFALTHCATTS